MEHAARAGYEEPIEEIKDKMKETSLEFENSLKDLLATNDKGHEEAGQEKFEKELKPWGYVKSIA